MTKNDELKDKIRRWLDEQGYPLEMRIASTLQQKGFRVIQSEYFVDPESGDLRELDIVSSKQIEILGVLLEISLLIECKRSSDKPWLLFTSDNVSLADPARIAQRLANSLGRHFLMEICHINEVQNIQLFQLPKRCAYGITQALTSGKDVCYSAVQSVSKAALATVIEDDKRNEKKKFMPFHRKLCSILFPVIVVEGRLFEVFLDDSIEVSISEIDTGTFLWRNQIAGMPHTIINIVSSNIFDQYAQESMESIQDLIALSDYKLSEPMRKAIALEKRPPYTLH